MSMVFFKKSCYKWWLLQTNSSFSWGVQGLDCVFPGHVPDVVLVLSHPCRCPWSPCWAQEGGSEPWWALLESWKHFMSLESWTVPPTSLGSLDPPGKAFLLLILSFPAASPEGIVTRADLSLVIIHSTFYTSKSAGGGVLGAPKGKDSSGSRYFSRNGWMEVPHKWTHISISTPNVCCFIFLIKSEKPKKSLVIWSWWLNQPKMCCMLREGF